MSAQPNTVAVEPEGMYVPPLTLAIWSMPVIEQVRWTLSGPLVDVAEDKPDPKLFGG